MAEGSTRDQLAAIVYRVNNPKYGDYSSHEETADAILAAGWRPPLKREPGDRKCTGTASYGPCMSAPMRGSNRCNQHGGIYVPPGGSGA